jgi:hypothetical protein
VTAHPAEKRSAAGEDQLPAGRGDQHGQDEHGLIRTARSGRGLPAEHESREVDDGERVQHRHPAQGQVGAGRAGRRSAEFSAIVSCAVTADRRHRPAAGQHDQHRGRPPSQRQLGRAQHGSQRRGPASGDERVDTISGGDAKRGEHASPQRCPRCQRDQVCRNRSRRHGDAVAGQEPRDQGGVHIRPKISPDFLRCC